MPEYNIDPSAVQSMPIAGDVTPNATDQIDNTTKAQAAEKFIQYGLPSAVAGFADTVAQSLSFGAVGKNAVGNLLTKMDKPFGQYYQQHKEAAQTVGDIAGSFIPVIGATKLIRAGSIMEKAVTNLTKDTKLAKFAGSIFATGKSIEDRVKEIQGAATLFATARNTDIAADPVLSAAMTKAKFGAAADAIKEGLAADAAITLTMNKSNTFFPDSLSPATNAALFLAPDAAFAGIAYKATKFQITRSLMDETSKLVAKSANPADYNITDIIDRPGARGPGVALRAVMRNDAKTEYSVAKNQQLKTNLNGAIQAWGSEIKQNVVKMGQETPVPFGLSTKWTPPDAVINNALKASEDDPAMWANVTHIEPLGNYGEYAAKKNKAYNSLVTKRAALVQSREAVFASGTAKDKQDWFDQIGQINQNLKDITERHNNVVENDGTLTDWSQRQSIFQDANGWQKQIKSRTDNISGHRMFSLDYMDEHGTKHSLGFTSSGVPVIQQTDKTPFTFAGVNVTKILQSIQDAESETKLGLNDLARNWHPKGDFGKDVFDNLPNEIKRAASDWTGSSYGSMIREWGKTNDPRLQQLYNAYDAAGFHARLRELANPDGTITLFRGESKAETANPTNDIVSMTPNPKAAKVFGEGPNKHVITRRVPVEDIIMPVGGLGDSTAKFKNVSDILSQPAKGEWEFIVKNNLMRNEAAGKAVEESTIKRNFESLDLQDRARMYGLAQTAAEKYRPGVDGKIYLPPDAHHLQIDYALKVAEMHGPENIELANGPYKSLEDLQFASIASKADEVQKLAMVQGAGLGAKPIINLATKHQYSYVDIPKMFNLPGSHAGQTSPLVQLLYDGAIDPSQIIPFRSQFKNLGDVKEAMVRLVKPDELGSELNPKLAMQGNMLAHDPSRQPFVISHAYKPEGPLGREQLMYLNAANKMLIQDHMNNALHNGADFIGTIHKTIWSHQDALEIASQVDRLLNNTSFGNSVITTSVHANRGNAVIHAADRISDMAHKIGLELTNQKLDPYRQGFRDLLSRSNETDLQHFLIARNSLGQGWRIKRGAAESTIIDEKTGQQLHHFVLEDHPFNHKKWKELYGEDMPEGALLPVAQAPKSGPAVPVAISDLAHQNIHNFYSLFQDILKNINYSRVGRGLKPIPDKYLYMPPLDLSKDHVVYLADNMGKIRHVVGGDTFNEAVRKARVAQDLLGEKGTNVHLMTEHTVANYFDNLNEVFGRLDDFSNSRLQTGMGKGKSFTPVVENGKAVVQDMIRTVQKQYDSLVKETLSNTFQSELTYAKHQIEASGLLDSVQAKQQRTIWDQYARAIYGKGSVNPNTPVGGLYNWAEQNYNTLVAAAFDKLLKVKNELRPAEQVGTRTDQRHFEQLQKSLGDFMPYSDFTDYLHRNTNVHVPQTLRKHMAFLNKVTAALGLRIFNAGMAVINFASLGAVAPAVVKGLARGVGEEHGAWLARIGAYSSPISDNAALWSPSKAVISAVHYSFTPEGRAALQRAADAGLLHQEVAERMNILTSPMQGYVQNLIKRGVDKASWLTDRSETMSRAWSYLLFENYGKKVLHLDDNAAMLFAHIHANDTIGDFRPNIRPQIFQGAAGMPLGLFTTFMWNFLQRTHGDIEAYRHGAYLTQIALQHALFGASSLPGWTQFVNTFTSNYDGSTNIIDGMNQRFGHLFTDWFVNGTVSTLPEMFGAKDGLAIQSRADIKFPLTAGGPLSGIPSYEMAKDFIEGLGKTVESIGQNGGFNGAQLGEIASNYAPLAIVRNVTQLAQGYQVNRGGNVVDANTRTWAGIAGRLMGFKTNQDLAKAKEMGRLHSIQAARAQAMSELRLQMRADIRHGNLTQEKFNQYVSDYLRAGGTVTDFKQFLQNQIMSGTVDRDQLQVLKLFHRSSMAGEVGRLMEVIDPNNSLVNPNN